MATKIIDIDLSRQLPCEIDAVDGDGVEAVVWLHGRPLGRVGVPRLGPLVYRRGLARSIVRLHADTILRELVRNGLATPGLEAFDVPGLLSLPVAEPPVAPGNLTAVICTDCSRPDRLDRCLAALVASGTPPAEAIVVCQKRQAGSVRSRRADAGTTGDTSLRLKEVQERWSTAAFPVRWLVEPSADLARARHLAVETTRTPLVAFLDESVRVDAHWLAAVCRTFEERPNAVVVTGVVLPDGEENEIGRLASSALQRMAWQQPFCFLVRCLRPDEPLPRDWLNPLQYGATAAVAYRTEAVVAGGGFLPVVAGEAAESGQHFDLWLRLLDRGMCVVREPAASCRAQATPSIGEATAAIRRVAAGISAALTAAAARRPSRLPSIGLVTQWFLRTAVGDLCRGRGVARSLAWARLRGHLAGMARACLGWGWRSSGRPQPAEARLIADAPFRGGRVVPIDLALTTAAGSTNEPRPPAETGLLRAAANVPVAEMLATWHGDVLGLVEIVNAFRPITLEQVRRAAIDRHWDTLLVRLLRPAADEPHEIDGSSRAERAEKVREAAARSLGTQLAPPPFPAAVGEPSATAAAAETVSIVIPSRDRPDDLRDCLRSILAQKTDRRVEVIVVDNHPESDLTPPVLAEFNDVRLLAERRQGSAYARNRGLLACRGSIIVCVDDDVIVSDGWLEKMLAPFAEQEVTVVTGNVVPLQLETAAERLTESCSSLSAGSEPFRVDGEWFHASPAAIQAWDFGASANMAARTRIFRDPAVGLFAESLGPGTPVGAGEDPYFFYRVVEAGYGLQYCPDAWVWHRHRRTTAGLRRQVFNYAKSAVGYYLLTGLSHGDRRSRMSLFGGLQLHYCRRLLAAARGRIDVPVWLVCTEIAGHLAGGFSYFFSEARRRSLDRDPAHQPNPPALPARTAASEQDWREPWAIVPKLEQGQSARTGTAVSRRRGGKLPDFLVIGAQKAGTTALHQNLKKHPAIELVPHFSSSKPGWENSKETHFFSGHGADHGIWSLYDYAALFNDNELVQGEVCPSYSAPAVVRRIADTVPEAKLIYICREPVARIESAINHMMQWFGNWPGMPGFCQWSPRLSVEANIQRELAHPSTYGLLRMGIYADTVEQVLRLFPRERLLLLVAEEYRDRPQQTYDTICSFLGVERHEIAHRDAHVRAHTTKLSPEQRAWLADFYRPHNERFFALLGREVPAWSGAEASAVKTAESS